MALLHSALENRKKSLRFLGLFSSHVETPKSLVPDHRSLFKSKQAAVLLNRPLSPSGLEALFNCSFQFMLSRLLKLRGPESWDPEDLKATDKGQWMHRVLELFYKEYLAPFDLSKSEQYRARLSILFEESHLYRLNYFYLLKVLKPLGQV